MGKGQTALEFLTTYGWALIVVLVVIGVIVYFNLVNFSIIRRDHCSFGAQFTCQEFDIQPDTVRLILQNGVGDGILMDSITERTNRLACNPIDMGDTAREEFICSVSPVFEEGAWADLNFDIVYSRNLTGSPVHNVTGRISGKVN